MVLIVRGDAFSTTDTLLTCETFPNVARLASDFGTRREEEEEKKKAIRAGDVVESCFDR